MHWRACLLTRIVDNARIATAYLWLLATGWSEAINANISYLPEAPSSGDRSEAPRNETIRS